MRFVLIALLVYLAYQFIFNFLVPLYIATQKIRKGFREMHNQANARQSSANPQDFTHTSSHKPGNKISKNDYIDFEEVK